MTAPVYAPQTDHATVDILNDGTSQIANLPDDISNLASIVAEQINSLDGSYNFLNGVMQAGVLPPPADILKIDISLKQISYASQLVSKASSTLTKSVDSLINMK